jgi:cyanate lyase
MRREQLTEKILDIKREKGWSWKHITGEIGGMSPVLVVGALLGQHKLVKPLARKAAALFGLSEMEERMLNEVPYRGTGTTMPPTDPLIYRFYELVLVNSPAWKALIEEEFGDGIMSAIDFDMVMVRRVRRLRTACQPTRAIACCCWKPDRRRIPGPSSRSAMPSC